MKMDGRMYKRMVGRTDEQMDRQTLLRRYEETLTNLYNVMALSITYNMKKILDQLSPNSKTNKEEPSDVRC